MVILLGYLASKMVFSTPGTAITVQSPSVAELSRNEADDAPLSMPNQNTHCIAMQEGVVTGIGGNEL